MWGFHQQFYNIQNDDALLFTGKRQTAKWIISRFNPLLNLKTLLYDIVCFLETDVLEVHVAVCMTFPQLLLSSSSAKDEESYRLHQHMVADHSYLVETSSTKTTSTFALSSSGVVDFAASMGEVVRYVYK